VSRAAGANDDEEIWSILEPIDAFVMYRAL
jgi:hypothetical protein